MSYRVCIPTAGIGSRLGSYTKYINKSLVSVANRPVISHIIEKFPKDVEFVIALGYKGNIVRDYLELAHSERVFIFCEVSPYDGPGSGLGLSLISCKDHLNEPFVFVSCDTLVEEKIPAPTHNWVGYATKKDLSQYRTVSLDNEQVVGIFEKGNDAAGLKAYIGLSGIYDYKLLWDTMLENKGEAIVTGEVQGLRKIIDKHVKGYKFTWYDTGNVSTLYNARKHFNEAGSPNILDKPNESIWFVGGVVIKFSDDKKFISNRIKRSQLLRGYVPQVIACKNNMYAYRKVNGEVMSKAVTLPLFKKLLNTLNDFWAIKKLSQRDIVSFEFKCDKFYRKKTYERIQKFYDKTKKKDGIEAINDDDMDTLKTYLNLIDWKWLSRGMPGMFHGDLHFENILWSSEHNIFTFLDWRQDFGGDLHVGDIYYDLAKLLHGLIISHELITKEQYHIKWGKEQINYDFNRKQVLVECETIYYDWLKKNNYDIAKVKVLTALIYLNIAGLHHHPYCLLLYALGKRMLKREMGANRGIN